MFKVSALALLVALCNASTSRRLLQTGAPVDPATVPAEPAAPVEPAIPAEPAVPATPVEPVVPATPAQPATPVQPVPPVAPPQPPVAQPRPAVPAPRPYNPYCDPMSGMYDYQDCIQYSYMFNGGGAYNPYGQQQPGQASNNPYCNMYSPMYDPQDCIQYQYMFGGGNPFGYQQPRPAAPQGPNTAPANPGYAQQPRPNPNNPYCNPYSGMYDMQDCYQTTYGFVPW